jgi:hypothetical protein
MSITDEQLRDPDEVKRILFNIKRSAKITAIERRADIEKNRIKDENDDFDSHFHLLKLKEAEPKNIFRETIVILTVGYWNEHEGFYGVNLIPHKFSGFGNHGVRHFLCHCCSGGWHGHNFDFDYKDAVKGNIRGCTTCESKYSDGRSEAEHKKKVESINKVGQKLTLLNYVQENTNALYHCGDCGRDFYERPMYLNSCVPCASDAEKAILDKRHSDYITYITINRPELTLKRDQLIYRYYERFDHYCSGCGTLVSFTAHSVLKGNGKCKICRANAKKLKFKVAEPKPLKRLKPIIYNLKPAKKTSPIKIVTVKYAVPLNSLGYVYAIRHEWLPGRVKVGATTTTPKNRAKSIQYGGTLPTPFIIIASEKVSSAMVAERIVHHELIEYHIGGEWFNCSDEDIKAAFLLLN